METKYAILAENVSKSYLISNSKIEEVFLQALKKNQEINVLDKINFKITQGNVIGIIGINGSGKSTLLKIIGGILKPNTGKLYIEGSIGSILELGSGFHPDLSGYDNIYFNASLHGFPSKEVDLYLKPIIDFSELNSFIYEPVKHYSSGMLMRLAFSIIVNLPFDILLLDEVFAVGDQSFKLKCMSKIKELAETNITIVLVSHDFSQLKNICQELIFIHNGNIIHQGSVNDVIESYILHTNFLNSGSKFSDGIYYWKNSNSDDEIKELEFFTSNKKYQFLSSEEIELNFIFVKHTDKKLNLAIVINSGIEQPFMAYSPSYSEEEEFNEIAQKGKYHFSTNIKSKQLNEGLILIDVHFIDDDTHEVCEIKSIAQIQIKKDWPKSMDFYSDKKFTGSLFPENKWKLVYHE